MTRKWLTLYLVLGILIGLLLTACASVASGKVDIPVGNDAFVFGPAGDILSAPALQVDVRPAMVQVHTERPLEMIRAAAAQMESQMGAQMPFAHVCNGGEH